LAETHASPFCDSEEVVVVVVVFFFFFWYEEVGECGVLLFSRMYVREGLETKCFDARTSIILPS
jgi:hypothetical protein